MILFILTLMLSSCTQSLKVTNCVPIYAMDTIINVTFYNEKNTDSHYNEIKKIYQLYDELADDFNSSAKYENIYSLNLKRNIEAKEELIELLEEAINLKTLTNGYFNPLIGRISHIWKDAITENGTYPTSVLITSELTIMNNSSITITGNKVELIGDANIDLGAMAKGYATEKVKEYLENNNVKGYLLSAGESNVLLGKKGDSNFKIGLTKPFSNEYIKVLECLDTSIGTSSYKYQKKEYEEGLAHHLINPFTGYPSNYYTSVNVMCLNSTLCDVYSTALFSMDLEAAISFAATQNIDILLYGNNEIIYQSEGLL